MNELLEKFLDGKVAIMLSRTEIPRLEELENFVKLRWMSGNRINSDMTENLLLGESHPIYIYSIKRTPDERRIVFQRNPIQTVVTLDEFLNTMEFNIKEEDVLSILEG